MCSGLLQSVSLVRHYRQTNALRNVASPSLTCCNAQRFIFENDIDDFLSFLKNKINQNSAQEFDH